jgi:hypothetical protein
MDFSIGSKYESSSAATISCAGELDVGSCRKLIDAIETVYQPELERLRVDLSEVPSWTPRASAVSSTLICNAGSKTFGWRSCRVPPLST